ncbi:MAG: hypothetical protein CMJ18_01030 [Phycisphaeraceae bacterium]|nr:hypothetical protein [Phycisphaeraceae bacterium]
MSTRGHDPRSDDELVAAVNRGDAEAFDVVYVRYRERVLAWAWRGTGNEADALDVVQETFRYLLSRFPGFRLTSRLTSLLYPVVRNLCRNRRSRPTDEGSVAWLEAATAAPGAGREAAEALARVLGSLAEAHREVVLLRYVDGLQIDEIAELLGVPGGTVKSRLHYALRRLRDDPVAGFLVEE